MIPVKKDVLDNALLCEIFSMFQIPLKRNFRKRSREYLCGMANGLKTILSKIDCSAIGSVGDATS